AVAPYRPQDAQARGRSRRDPWEPSFAGWSVDLQPRRSPYVSGPNHHGTRAAEPETPHGTASRSTKPLFFNDIDRWVFRCAVVPGDPGIEVSLQLLDASVDTFAERHLIELLQDGLVEALADAVGLRAPRLGAAVVDVLHG